MLITLSPSKGQDFEQAAATQSYTHAPLLADSAKLIGELKNYSQQQIAQLMAISEKLAQLNYQRFHDFSLPFNCQNAKAALFAFKGDVYSGINTASMQQTDFEYAQGHVRILSGLYGYLRPLDLIQPYRLEMKTKLKTSRGANLYQFWGNKITDLINQDLAQQKNKILLNLASNEYYKVINPKNINGKIVSVAFKEEKEGKSRIIAIYAKKARGMMTDFVIRHQIDNIDGVKDFNYADYKYDTTASTDNNLVFCRKQPKPLSR